MFLAPQCTALRCPWVSALILPVGRVPSCARGRPGVLFTAHLHMYNKSVLQYCRYIKNDDHHHHEPRTKFHLIERIYCKYSSVSSNVLYLLDFFPVFSPTHNISSYEPQKE